jgi:hypothetical protein
MKAQPEASNGYKAKQAGAAGFLTNWVYLLLSFHMLLPDAWHC